MLSTLPLSYCTNVHPGRSLAEVEAGLDRYTVPVMRAYGQPLAAGLWLARAVVAEVLREPDGIARLAQGLRRRGLSCHTLNAFPYGDFHSERVKEKVYLPDWTQRERLDYTIHCARVLAGLLPDGVDEGSISTLPLGFREFRQPPGFRDRCAAQLVVCARELAKIREETGRTIRLSIEPEPFCVVETTPEAVDWFHHLWRRAEDEGASDAVRTHVGVCFDVCHQAVEFEDVTESIQSLDREGIRINKIHASCALQLDDPRNNAAGRAALKRYVEPRYLHQTFAGTGTEWRVKAVDLTHALIDSQEHEFVDVDAWRVHFHVPVDAERIGPLATTRGILRQALAAVAALDYAPHIEVETYTWEVLPGEEKSDLVSGLTRELVATRQLLAEVSRDAKMPAAIRD
jgi:sugar phosphate isomerase/epimerase